MKIKKIIIIVISIMLIVSGSVWGYGYYQLSKVKTTKISNEDKELGIKKNTEASNKESDKESNKTVNIALFGVDSRAKQSAGSNSDSIMIMSIDKAHKKIKLSSIMRDSYVSIENHGKTKINAAYAYAGPELAIKTINQNFDMDIRDFVTVNFFGMEKIIDKLDGIQADVKESEIEQVNKYMAETAEIEKKVMVPITHSGKQNLNGLQAVSYARIRCVGNGDFERTQRQNVVITALLEKIQKAGVTKYPGLVSELLPNVETSLSKINIVKLGSDVLSSGVSNVDWVRFPVDGYCNQLVVNEGWYLSVDIDATKGQLHDFIYNDVKPVPKKPLF